MTFARLMEILKEQEGEFCIMACILAGNKDSLEGMRGLGMKDVTGGLPLWLRYDHRSWNTRVFPIDPKTKSKIKRPRIIQEEAHYLWLPPEAARRLADRALELENGKPLRRDALDGSGRKEEYTVRFDTLAILNLRKDYGSLEEAIDTFRFDAMLHDVPRFARLGDGYFGGLPQGAQSPRWVEAILEPAIEHIEQVPDAHQEPASWHYLNREEQVAAAFVLGRDDVLDALGITLGSALVELDVSWRAACEDIKSKRR